MNRILLSLRDIVLDFDSESQNHSVLKGISTDIFAGDWIMINGSNGSGKSTLLKIVGGTLHPTSGKRILNTKERGVVFVFQNPAASSPAMVSCVEALWLADKTAPRRKSDARIKYRGILNEFELSGHLDTLLGSLSGGQKQVISLLMAKLRCPSLLLLDEPTASLDADNETKCLDILKKIHKAGGTILHVTHNAHHYRSLGSRRWVLRDGTLHENDD